MGDGRRTNPEALPLRSMGCHLSVTFFKITLPGEITLPPPKRVKNNLRRLRTYLHRGARKRISSLHYSLLKKKLVCKPVPVSRK